jgi:hypothetical protein
MALKICIVACIFSLRLTDNAALAQSVEQRTENPCVRCSIHRGGIKQKALESSKIKGSGAFLFLILHVVNRSKYPLIHPVTTENRTVYGGVRRHFINYPQTIFRTLHKFFFLKVYKALLLAAPQNPLNGVKSRRPAEGATQLPFLRDRAFYGAGEP